MLFFTAAVGCAPIRNKIDQVTGRYMGGLQRASAKEKSTVVNYGIAESFDRVSGILIEMKATVVKVDVHNYAILAVISGGPMMEEETESTFEANTADVGIFFTEESPTQTKISIRCLSETIADYTAKNIFSKL